MQDAAAAAKNLNKNSSKKQPQEGAPWSTSPFENRVDRGNDMICGKVWKL